MTGDEEAVRVLIKFLVNRSKSPAKKTGGWFRPIYTTTVNLLLVGAKNKQHLMYIKDIEAVTKLHICPK
jgi:hypothetical protein